MTGEPAQHGVELAVLVGAGLLGTGLRFALLRSWIFREAAQRAESGINVTAATN